MQRTIKVKIETDSSLLKTLEIYSKIFKNICEVGYKEMCWNKIELHKLTYQKLRSQYPNFPSALLQTVRDVASENLKKTKCKKEINAKSFTSARLDKRNLRVDFKNKLISISTVDGRKKIPFVFNKFSQRYSDWSPIAATLSYKNGCLWLNVVIEKQQPDNIAFTEKEILGIDRGINNILVCSNNQFFNSKHLKKVKGEYQHQRKMLQSKGTASAKRKLKKVSGRERRFVSDINHRLSKGLVESDFKVFVLEALKKMTNTKNGRKFNKKLGNWSFKQFEMFLKYKAEALGKQVISVNPKNTSRLCSNCGIVEKNNRKGSWYHCKSCGFQLQSDLNAARNIADLGKSGISRLHVNQPNVESQDIYKPIISMIGS